MSNKLITITGGDLCGKATQAAILQELITQQYGVCGKFSFPRYDRPFGKIMGAMLDEHEFAILGAHKGRIAPIIPQYPFGLEDLSKVSSAFEPYRLRDGRYWTGMLSKRGREEVFQFLCGADKYDAQEDIGKALEVGHVICDRYDPELLVYGALDANEDLARMMLKGLTYKSDVVIVLINSEGQFTRPGEIPDVNERDRSFQLKTISYYRKFSLEYGWHILDVADTASDNVFQSVCRTNDRILEILNDSGLILTSDGRESIARSVLETKGFPSEELEKTQLRA